jgi:hypothetical protein
MTPKQACPRRGQASARDALLARDDSHARGTIDVGLAKAPKNFVLRALDELQVKGLVKRKAREKAAGYYLIPKP